MRSSSMVVGAVLALSSTACVVRTAPPRNPNRVSLEQWNAAHPQAANELCQWARNHPDAAPRFFEWDGHHPDRSREFVEWTLQNPGRGIDGFVSGHPNWADFDFISETHHPAANAFMAWVRRHPEAAEDLMNHGGGLQWAGRHGSC